MIIFFFIYSSLIHARCGDFARAEELLNTKKFVSSSNERRVMNEERRRLNRPTVPEEEIVMGDRNMARNYAMKFPAFRDLGFPEPGTPGWQPHIKRAVGGSKAGGLRDGLKINHHGRYAEIRLDWDPHKGMHYNIVIEDQSGVTHKLAVKFDCNNSPCSEAQYLRAVNDLTK